MNHEGPDFILRHMDKALAFWRRCKWWLLLSVVLPLAVVYVFFLNPGLKRRELLTLRSLSLDLKDGGISVTPMQREEYDKILFFLEDETLWREYLQALSLPPESRLWRKKPSGIFSEVFSFQLTPERLKQEVLQYLVLNSDSLPEKDLAVAAGYFKGVFGSYFLKELLKDYQLYFINKAYLLFRTNHDLLLRKEYINRKLIDLESRKGAAAARGGGYQLMLQLEPGNERYLEVEQQLLANRILQSDNLESLAINDRELALLGELLRIIRDLQARYFASSCWQFAKPLEELRKLRATARTKDLDQEIARLEAAFELVETNFRSDAFSSSRREPEYYLLVALAYMALVLFGLLLVLMVDIRRSRKKPAAAHD